MNDQERAKAAVEWLKVAYVCSQDGIAARNYARHLLRPIAAGTHVIVPVESLKKLHDQISIVGGDMRALETVSKMIAASQEGE